MRSPKGSVYQIAPGVWRVQVTGGLDLKTGKKDRPSAVVRGSRKKAEEKKLALLVQVGAVEYAREKMTLLAFWETIYLPDCESRLRPTTVYCYKNHFAVHCSPLFGLLLSDITPATVTKWLADIDGAKRQREALKVLRQVMNAAVKLDLIEANPCSRVQPPRCAPAPIEVLDAQDTQVYLWHFEHTELGALVLVVLGCALTRSEAVALNWEDIRGREVTIDNAVTSLGGRPHDDKPKTRHRVRKVYIPASISQRLERLRGTGPIVKDGNGGRMNPDNVTKLYRRLLGSLPDHCKRVPLKNLRHTSLSLAIQAHADIYEVSRTAGHASVRTTETFYLNPEYDYARNVSNKLDGLL